MSLLWIVVLFVLGVCLLLALIYWCHRLYKQKHASKPNKHNGDGNCSLDHKHVEESRPPTQPQKPVHEKVEIVSRQGGGIILPTPAESASTSEQYHSSVQRLRVI